MNNPITDFLHIPSSNLNELALTVGIMGGSETERNILALSIASNLNSVGYTEVTAVNTLGAAFSGDYTTPTIWNIVQIHAPNLFSKPIHIVALAENENMNISAISKNTEDRKHMENLRNKYKDSEILHQLSMLSNC